MGYGDALLVSGRARVMQKKDRRKCRPTFQGRMKWSAVWDNNPRIARMEEVGDFQELVARDAGNHRPYHIDKTPERWTYNLKFRPDVGEIYFSDAELEFGARHKGMLLIEPHIKNGASPNKNWGWSRWNKLAWLMQRSGLRVMQLGLPGTALVDRAELIVTDTFRLACAVISGARACVFPEGGSHHAAAALGVPAVVIFGGFTPVELTGYAIHTNLGASLGEACGMRLPCKHCEAAMAAITPEAVFRELKRRMK